jgi:hypothetical protein
MARSRQTARKSCGGKAPRLLRPSESSETDEGIEEAKRASQRERSHKCRSNKKAKLKNDMDGVNILVIVSPSHVKKVKLEDVDPLPWKDDLIKNHDIFALNNVHNATILEQNMFINAESSQELIQEIIDNPEMNDDMTYNPYDPISSIITNGTYEMPDANHAVALAFQGGYASEDKKDEVPFIPTVYFVKRQTLMYCIDHPTNPLKKKIALQFIKNNFDHLYICNDDDLLGQSLATYNIKTSQWHALLNFFGEVRVAGRTSIYPPLSMVHQLDDKYQQKHMLGDATLPYFKVQLPLQHPLPADKGKNSWKTKTWTSLYDNLLSGQPLLPIPNEVLKGIVIKPRFGCGGNGIVILRKIETIVDPSDSESVARYESDDEVSNVSNTIEAITFDSGECPASPSEWLTWDDDDEVPVDLGDYFVEPFCPCLQEGEHRVYLTMASSGNGFTWLYSCSAELNMAGEILVGPLTSMENHVRRDLSEMSVKLKEQMRLSVPDVVTSQAQGMIYRVDCCFAGREDYPHLLAFDWMINEMQLVPVAQSFISDYHHHSPYTNVLADGLHKYVTKCKNPYYPA